jgi:hypothetical protein
MNRSAASAIATRIAQTWPSMRIPTDLWEDALTPLDEGSAGTTYARLRTSAQHPPTIADFMATYRGLHTATLEPVTHACERCNREGWVSFQAERLGAVYTGIRPCSCPAGRQHDGTWSRIIDERDERDRRRQ